LTVTNAVVNVQNGKGAPNPELTADGVMPSADHSRRTRWRHRLERPDLAARTALLLIARPLRGPDRVGDRRPRPERREVDRRRRQARRRHRQGDPPRVEQHLNRYHDWPLETS
jgi:hypothetical protein